MLHLTNFPAVQRNKTLTFRARIPTLPRGGCCGYALEVSRRYEYLPHNTQGSIAKSFKHSFGGSMLFDPDTPRKDPMVRSGDRFLGTIRSSYRPCAISGRRVNLHELHKERRKTELFRYRRRETLELLV